MHRETYREKYKDTDTAQYIAMAIKVDDGCSIFGVHPTAGGVGIGCVCRWVE